MHDAEARSEEKREGCHGDEVESGFPDRAPFHGASIAKRRYTCVMHGGDHGEHGHDMSYMHLAVMAMLSFIAMYVLMYAMVNAFGNVYASFNQFYMAGLMAAPMVIIELVVMRMMYPRKGLNLAIILGSILLLVLFWFAIRQQTAIGDEQFLRSMIPHHAGAILMCEQASIDDPEIRQLCEGIVEGQQKEIDQMKAKLESLQ